MTEARLDREKRARNYAVKKRSGFRCEELLPRGEDEEPERCGHKDQLLVVRLPDGAGHGVRCQPHVGDLKVEPGQWPEKLGKGS